MFLRVLLLVFLVGSLGAATSNDPSEEFVAAYRSFKEAERLDQAGRKDEAVAKYRYAENHFIDISNNYPNWQKPIVEYRLSKIRNNLARINASSSSSLSPASNAALASSNDSDHASAEANHDDVSHSSNEGRREEPRYGSEQLAASPSGDSSASDSEGMEPAPQVPSKKVSDIPTISIIPPVAKKPSLNSKELLQLQKQLKQTEAELEKSHADIVDKTAELDRSKVSLVEAKAQLAKTERQMIDLKNDLEKNRTGSLQREAVLKKSLQQLEGKVAALSADKEVILEENNGLQQRLQTASNSLETGVTNKNHLEQLQLEVNAEKNASAVLHEQLMTAQRERDEAHAERAALTQQVKQTSDSLIAAEKKGHDLESLQKQVAMLQDQLQQTNSLLEVAQKKNSEMEASTNQSTTIQKQALVDLEEKSRVALMERQSMEAKKEEIEKQLASANEKIKSLMVDAAPNLAAAQTELQQSQADLQAAKKQLEESEKKIAALEKAGPEKDHFLQEKEKELALARDEAGKFQKELLLAQQQLASIQEEVKNRDDRYNDLKKQLDQKNEEITKLQKKGTPIPDQEKIVAENELLKGIVLRELKAEAKRQQLRKLVTEDLDKLKVKSDTLSLQLQKLAKPVKLTAEERALFKDKLPLSSESDTEEDKLIVSVEASKNGKNDIAANPLPLSPAPTNAVAGPTPVDLKKKEEGKDAKKEPSSDQEKYRVAISKAKEQFEHQNYTEAEKNFQDALSASPNDYMTLSNLGVVEFQLGKMAEAESLLKRACVQEPKKSFAFTTLGIVHYRQERFDEAEKVLRQAVAINDQDFTAHNYLGIVLAASGKSKAGESEIMKSIEINPNYADAHFNLAVIYATGKPPAKEMAKTHYKKAIALGAPADPTLEKLIN